MKVPLNEQIQELVTKAFVLEAVTDKPGCTTRYKDLPGKPLQDFLVAGINYSRFFALLARDMQASSKSVIFSHNLEALKASNEHKSNKYLNFGLLEIMFPVVAARLQTDDPATVVPKVIKLIKSSSNKDLQYLLQTRKLAWSTSATPHKVGFKPEKYKQLGSVWDFYMAINADFGPGSSNFQWTEQYKKGLPILTAFFEAYMKSGEIMKTTEKVFEVQRRSNPKAAVGILADMCAAAIFLWLSFNNQPV